MVREIPAVFERLFAPIDCAVTTNVPALRYRSRRRREAGSISPLFCFLLESALTMDESHERDEVGVICPSCLLEAKKSVGWLREHTQLECSRCGQLIDVESRNFRKPGAPC
jgi:hypothetical protein